MVDKPEDQIDLKFSRDKLRSLYNELKIQEDTTVNQINMLEHKLLESTLSLRSSDRESSRINQIEEISKQMSKLHAALDPLNKRRALVEALLDPSTVFWLSLRLGDHKQIVEEAIADILNRDIDVREFSDDPTREEDTSGHDAESAAAEEADTEEEEISHPPAQEETKGVQPEDKRWKRRRPPKQGGGAFDNLLDD